MDKEKRMIRDYEVKQSFELGKSEIVLAENLKAEDGFCYMIADYQRNDIFERYDNVILSNTYIEILEEFQSRVQSRISELKQEQDKISVPQDIITADMCYPNDYSKSIVGKVIAIRADILKPEYRNQSVQLVYATGGNGAHANARGSAVFCTNLYSKERSRFERRDVLGIVKEECLPRWAKEAFAEIQKQEKQKEPER